MSYFLPIGVIHILMNAGLFGVNYEMAVKRKTFPIRLIAPVMHDYYMHNHSNVATHFV